MNGLVDADRRPHPAMAEVKYLYQPCVMQSLAEPHHQGQRNNQILTPSATTAASARAGGIIAGADSGAGRYVWVLNRLSFRALEPSFVRFKWRLFSDCRLVRKGVVTDFTAVSGINLEILQR